MSNHYYRVLESVKYPKMRTIFPGSNVYDVAKYVLTHRLRSGGLIWYSNLTPMIDKLGNKSVLRAFDHLRSDYGMLITKPTNKQFMRPNVWAFENFEHIRFYTPPTVEEDTRP